MSEAKNFSKLFISKNSACRFQYSPELKAVFVSAGKKSEDQWTWQRAKMTDSELGEIIRVLDGSAEKVSFFHKFHDKETKIWVNRNEENVFIRVNDQSKPLSPGEQMVLKILLQGIIEENSKEPAWQKETDPLERNASLMEFMV